MQGSFHSLYNTNNPPLYSISVPSAQYQLLVPSHHHHDAAAAATAAAGTTAATMMGFSQTPAASATATPLQEERTIRNAQQLCQGARRGARLLLVQQQLLQNRDQLQESMRCSSSSSVVPTTTTSPIRPSADIAGGTTTTPPCIVQPFIVPQIVHMGPPAVSPPPSVPASPPVTPPPSVVGSAARIIPRNVKDDARNLDLEYVRMVCGAAHARNISTVWGPRDGISLTMVDSRRLQDLLFNYISQQMLNHLNQNPAQVQGGNGLPPAQDMQLMGSIARQARQAFNDGWNIENDVGILHETLAAEIQVQSIYFCFFVCLLLFVAGYQRADRPLPLAGFEPTGCAGTAQRWADRIVGQRVSQPEPCAPHQAVT